MKEKARHVSAPGKDPDQTDQTPVTDYAIIVCESWPVNLFLRNKYNHIEVAGRVKGCYNDLIRIVCNCLKILSFISDTYRTCSCERIRTCHIV
jgi:hypothetical protein